MKIRGYIVQTDGTTDPIREAIEAQEPAGIDWVSYHYPHNDNEWGLVFIRAADDFPFDQAANLSGVQMLPVAKLDTPLSAIPKAKRDSFRAFYESRWGPLDVTGIDDYEDLICSIFRANGETGRMRLRTNSSQRTREFMDSFDG